ncbi:MAG: hypothetical protein ACI86H_002248 [bacterium]|jgi:hypothetical protein
MNGNKKSWKTEAKDLREKTLDWCKQLCIVKFLPDAKDLQQIHDFLLRHDMKILHAILKFGIQARELQKIIIMYADQQKLFIQIDQIIFRIPYGT